MRLLLPFGDMLLGFGYLGIKEFLSPQLQKRTKLRARQNGVPFRPRYRVSTSSVWRLDVRGREANLKSAIRAKQSLRLKMREGSLKAKEKICPGVAGAGGANRRSAACATEEGFRREGDAFQVHEQKRGVIRHDES